MKKLSIVNCLAIQRTQKNDTIKEHRLKLNKFFFQFEGLVCSFLHRETLCISDVGISDGSSWQMPFAQPSMCFASVFYFEHPDALDAL